MQQRNACPVCYQMVDVDSAFCKHCGAECSVHKSSAGGKSRASIRDDETTPRQSKPGASVLFFIVIAVVLIATNPGLERHKEVVHAELKSAFQQKHKTVSALSSIVSTITGFDAVGTAVNEALEQVQCSDYLVSSACYLNGSLVTFGIAGRVFAAEISVQ